MVSLASIRVWRVGVKARSGVLLPEEARVRCAGAQAPGRRPVSAGCRFSTELGCGCMAQHFFLSKEVRDFTVLDLHSMTDEQIHQLFCMLRWGSVDKQTCPSCGDIAAHYWRKPRQQWRCRSCSRDFSVTSGTAFAYRKKPLRVLLAIILQFVLSQNGVSATELRIAFGMMWRSAWLICCKAREAIIKNNLYQPIQGRAQMDGAYFGGKRRSANQHGAQRDERAIIDKLQVDNRSMRNKRRLNLTANDKANLHRKKKRRCVLVLREIDPIPGKGASRTLVYIARSENEADAMQFARRYIAPGTVVETDEGPAFTPLSAWTEHRTVVHSREWVTKDGVSDNQAESFYSRFRRAEYGVFHGFRPTYLIDYAAEFAWREDHRRQSTRERFGVLVKALLTKGPSRWWSNYRHGNRRQQEILGPADASIAGRVPATT